MHACLDVCLLVRMCVCVNSLVFMFCFFYLEGLREGEGSKGRGIAEMTVSHTASNKIHGKILHLWNKCLLEKRVLLLFSCC